MGVVGVGVDVGGDRGKVVGGVGVGMGLFEICVTMTWRAQRSLEAVFFAGVRVGDSGVGAEGLLGLVGECRDLFWWVGLPPVGWNVSEIARVMVRHGVFPMSVLGSR